MKALKLPSIGEIFNCLQKFKWFLCHATHPICQKSNPYGKKLPCRQHCFDVMNLKECKNLTMHIQRLFSINVFCPTYFRSMSFLNCSYYPKRDPNDEDSCQWNERYLRGLHKFCYFVFKQKFFLKLKVKGYDK